MPLTIDIFQNKCFYTLWGWVGHVGSTPGSGHLYSVTRTENGTDFVVHNDGECTRLSETRSVNNVTKFLEGEDSGFDSSQAVLVVYVKKDVAEKV